MRSTSLQARPPGVSSSSRTAPSKGGERDAPQVAQRRLEPGAHVVADAVQAQALGRRGDERFVAQGEEEDRDDLRGGGALAGALEGEGRRGRRTHVVVALEVVQRRVLPQDDEDGPLELDAQAVAVLVSHVCRVTQRQLSSRLDHRAGEDAP